MSEAQQPEFSIQQVYVKDLSFEAPKAAHLLGEQWSPQVKIDVDTTDSMIGEGQFEVALKVTAEVTMDGKPAFIAEVVQAGSFVLKHFEEEQQAAMLGSFCASLLFPYAREAISTMVVRGGFPPLYLAPINFDAVYQQKQAQKEEQAN